MISQVQPVYCATVTDRIVHAKTDRQGQLLAAAQHAAAQHNGACVQQQL
jgi:hypothetical protein